MIEGAEVWKARFDEALKEAREAEEGSQARHDALARMRALGMTEGDVLYWLTRNRK